MRLGDLDALKLDLAKEIKTNDMGLWLKILLVIDNAPTVEPKFKDDIIEAFNLITDQEFEHSDSFWIETPKGKKIEFVKKRPQGEWIPITTRPMTEVEEKDACERLGVDHLEDYEKRVFTCPLPDDGQGILISTHWGVSLDECEIDPDYGYGLENNGDWDGVLAWMPLPEPYKDGGDKND